jgi:hypothetical protein
VERNKAAIIQVCNHEIPEMMGVASQEYLRMNTRTLSVHIIDSEVKDNGFWSLVDELARDPSYPHIDFSADQYLVKKKLSASLY